MDPVQAALLAGLLPGAIAFAGLALGLLLSATPTPGGRGTGTPTVPEGRSRTGAEDPEDPGPSRRDLRQSTAAAPPEPLPPGTVGVPGLPARLAVSGAAGLAVALSFFLIQEQLKPGSTGLWPNQAINRAAGLSVVCAAVGVLAAAWPRSPFVAPLALGLAGALFAWGLGGPVAGSAGQLAGWIAGAAAWGLVVGSAWRLAGQRSLAGRGGAAILAASALVPLGAAPVLFFGGGSFLPQPAMSLVAVAGATVAAMLLAGPARIAPLAGGAIPLLASGALLLMCAMWTNYRPSLPALGLLLAAPLGLLPAALLAPRSMAARWALAIVPVLLLVTAAGIVAWQMAPQYEDYGY